MTLASLTTLGVGGMIDDYRPVRSEVELISTVRQADEVGRPLLILGGGSNIVAPDAGFPGTVIQDRRHEITLHSQDACGGANVTVSAGASWDEFVAHCVDNGWSGVEALSGIPGTVGATPIQNVGAYGQQVSDTIASVRTWDRETRSVRTLTWAQLKFGYRTSVIKRTLRTAGRVDSSSSTAVIAGPGRERTEAAVDALRQVAGSGWFPSPRFVVLDVTFQFSLADRGTAITYPELARSVGVDVGQRAPAAAIREHVLAIRRSKAMVHDPGVPDSHSAGSFFTNPIVTPEVAATLPVEAPRFPADGLLKLSAAWLITHAGIDRGSRYEPGGAASISSRHSLAITNQGGASAADVLRLARFVRDRVWEQFGVELVPEPVIIQPGWEPLTGS